MRDHPTLARSRKPRLQILPPRQSVPESSARGCAPFREFSEAPVNPKPVLRSQGSTCGYDITQPGCAGTCRS